MTVIVDSCPNCGAALGRGSTPCVYCGSPFRRRPSGETLSLMGGDYSSAGFEEFRDAVLNADWIDQVITSPDRPQFSAAHARLFIPGHGYRYQYEEH